MYDELQLIRGNDYIVNDKISIHHPTLDEITKVGESNYYSMVNAFTATPTDCMGLLDDIGIDYEEIDEFSLFMMLSKNVSISSSRLLFRDIDFSKFVQMMQQHNQEVVMVDLNNEIIIDKAVYEIISGYIRKLHGLTKNVQKAGNIYTKRFLIEDAKKKAKLQRKTSMTLASIVMKLTNSKDFKYDIFNVWNLPIYVFMTSFHEVQKNVDYELLMNGIYSGTIDRKKVSEKDMSWFRYD